MVAVGRLHQIVNLDPSGRRRFESYLFHQFVNLNCSLNGPVVELADTKVLGAFVERRAGSNPVGATNFGEVTELA